MTDLRPWSGFDTRVDGLARIQLRAREAAVRSVDEILTLRNWLIGAWIVAYEQEGADRARYGERLIDALAAAFRSRGVQGLSGRNLRNYRQIAMTWPRLAAHQSLSGDMGLSGQFWQTLSAESLPALVAGDRPRLSDMRQTASGESLPAVRVEVLYESETFWLDQRRMAELLGVDVRTVSYHLKEIYGSGELTPEATLRTLLRVQAERNREVWREIEFYNLDAIISVG